MTMLIVAVRSFANAPKNEGRLTGLVTSCFRIAFPKTPYWRKDIRDGKTWEKK